MAKYDGSLRGYAFPTHKRDNFVCKYCGLNGKVWPNWLYLSWDHLLPEGDPRRDHPDYIVTACLFCNSLRNRTRFEVEGKTPEELVAQKRPSVLRRRKEYEDFWNKEVRS